jgi:hypothetical protein
MITSLTRRAAGVVLVWIASAAAAAVNPDPLTAAIDLKVSPVVASDGRLLVSFALTSPLTEDVKTVLKSGLTLEFTYIVELRRPSLWFDPTLGLVTVGATAKFDPLARTYQVSKFRQGQAVKSDTVEQESQVREWLTQFDSVLVEPSSPLELNSDYYVRVRLRVDPKSSFPFWPWRSDDASGRQSFTFIR